MSETITRRRHFIKKVLGSFTGGLALCFSGKLPADQSAPAANHKSQPAAKGYRETQHIRSYYQKARF